MSFQMTMCEEEEAQTMREDLRRRMFRWSEDWQMLFNVEKLCTWEKEATSSNMKWK